MPGIKGPPVARHLEEVHIASDINQVDCRLLCRLPLGPRTWAGRLGSGHVRVGDDVVLLPGGACAVAAGTGPWRAGQWPRRAPPLSIAVELDRDVDVQRGDMLVRVHNRPDLRCDVDAMVLAVWRCGRLTSQATACG